MNHLGTERVIKKLFYRWKDSFEDGITKIMNIFIYMYKNIKSSKDRLIYGKQTYLQQTGTII